MEAKELRQFGMDELKGRVRQWREELFRTRFKGRTAEAQDTSVCKKLKKDIARALTILNQKGQSGDIATSIAKVDVQPSDKKVAKAALESKPVESKEPGKAKTTKKKDQKPKAPALKSE